MIEGMFVASLGLGVAAFAGMHNGIHQVIDRAIIGLGGVAMLACGLWII